MKEEIYNADEIFSELDSFDLQDGIATNFAAQLNAIERATPRHNMQDFDLQLEMNSSNNATREQIAYLNSKLQQACSLLTKERAEKQNAIKLLKEKLHEIQKLQAKLKQMNENIKCTQEHISIERNNYSSAKNKLTYVATKLQTAEKSLRQKDALINNLQNEHAESMRRTKMLIEEFYRYKFLEEITYSDLDDMKVQQLEYLQPSDSYI